MFRVLARAAADEEGQDLIEYALLAALIAVIAVATITKVGEKLNTFYFTKIDQSVP